MDNENIIRKTGFEIGQVLYPDSDSEKYTGNELYKTTYGNKTNVGLFYTIQKILKSNGLLIVKEIL